MENISIKLKYLKLYNCVQINDYYYKIGVVTSNHLIAEFGIK